jgi:hypothetical protein
MLRQGSGEGEVDSMLRLLCDYEAKCLAGEASTPEEAKQVGLLTDQQPGGRSHPGVAAVGLRCLVPPAVGLAAGPAGPPVMPACLLADLPLPLPLPQRVCPT